MAAVTRFLELALVDVLFVLSLATAGGLYAGHIHTAGIVAIIFVLVVFGLAAIYALKMAWLGHGDIAHVELAANLCPMIGIAGVAGGFLIALSGGAEDVQARIIGASSGLAATVVAVAAMAVLEVQAHMLRGPKTQCCR